MTTATIVSINHKLVVLSIIWLLLSDKFNWNTFSSEKLLQRNLMLPYIATVALSGLTNKVINDVGLMTMFIAYIMSAEVFFNKNKKTDFVTPVGLFVLALMMAIIGTAATTYLIPGNQ